VGWVAIPPLIRNPVPFAGAGDRMPAKGSPNDFATPAFGEAVPSNSIYNVDRESSINSSAPCPADFPFVMKAACR
jgi:hypothetical protein